MMKSQTTLWEKILRSHISSKGLKSRLHKELKNQYYKT